MLFAALLLSVGSLFLLIAALSLFPSPLWLGMVWVSFTALAVVAHALAWFELGLALLVMGRSRPSWGRPVRGGMTGAFLASLIGFGIGLALLPVSTPETSRLSVFVSYVVPYLPSVYGWVVVAHAVLFAIASRALSSGSGSLIMVVGSAWLIIVAFIAIYAGPFQTRIFDPLLLWSLSGLTFVGYGLVTLGWWGEIGSLMNSVVGGARPEEG